MKLFKNYLLMTITLFATEIIFRLVMKMAIFEWSLLRVFVAVSIISLITALLTSKLKKLPTKIIMFIICLIASFYAILQAGFENYIGVFMSLGTSSQAGAVKDYIKDYIESFHWYYWLILTPIFLHLIYITIIEKRIGKKKNTSVIIEDNLITKRYLVRSQLVALTSLIILLGVFYFTLTSSTMQNSIQLQSNTSLFLNPSMPNIAVDQFGVTTYGLLDVKSTLAPTKEEIADFEITQKKEVKKETDYTRKIDDSKWREVSDNETNNNYKTLNSYFLNRDITDKNKHTGELKGKNLIVIMMESANTIAIDEKYFPNLARLYREGWSWSNAYSPRNSCSTGNNEMSGMVSLYTINNTCTANIYKRNVYPESLFNLFNEAGYTTTSYHNYTEHYYRRRIIHTNMGSGHYYGVEELGIPYSTKYEEWPSDVELMEKVLDNIKEQKQFMTWITTVTSHQPYGVDSKMGNLYVDDYLKLGYSKPLARYMSKLKTLDDSIGVLIKGLKEQGKLDDTVIVLYGDHYPYGLKDKTLNEYFDYDVSVNNETDRTPFIIYNSEMEPNESDNYTTFMNIVPTIANLFDLDYDPRLYAGEDLFSENYSNRVYFANGSWQDKKAFYNATTGKIFYTDENDTYTTEEIQSINKEIDLRIKMSNLAIKTNYFKHIYDSIKENEIKETTTKVDKDTKGSS